MLFRSLVKQLLAGLAVLIIIFGVIRPMLRDLSKREVSALDYIEDVPEDGERFENSDEISAALEKMNQEVEKTAAAAEADSNQERELLDRVRTMVAANPKVAANIIKQWMTEGK